jgi:hypothetical protein
MILTAALARRAEHCRSTSRRGEHWAAFAMVVRFV